MSSGNDVSVERFITGNDDENDDKLDEYEEKNQRVTRNAYVKYRLGLRPNEFIVFILGRKLFQQWAVDNYVKIEQDKIRWCALNQKKLRADSYQNLKDHVNTKANNVHGRIGKIVILPSTFVGSPRYMMQNYQDAMAIVRKYGKPDLFITMTCNPNWREIKNNLLPNQAAHDRPDLCARVFHLKKNHLLTLIKKKNFFGKAIAHVHVVEFQKRGLPHAHILVTLKEKLSTSDKIDEYISAEIPDPETDQELYDIVTQNMIHGPCNERCLVNGKCSKYYPKDFREETVLNADGYPFYRRRNDGRTILKRGTLFDNRHVVPYCPQLLKIFNCHINVEVVSSIKSVKYLHKYVYKGHDSATVIIENTPNEIIVNHDEIKNYVDTRYVGPVEACYRIFNKPLQQKSHSIVRLPIHLHDQQCVIITDDNMEQSLNDAVNKSSMLLDYFRLNVRDETQDN